MNIQQQLLDALQEYRSQFGQALEAHRIRFGPAQQQAEEKAMQAITAAESAPPPIEADLIHELADLLSQAVDRFTYNDMMPQNHALKAWTAKALEAVSKVPSR